MGASATISGRIGKAPEIKMTKTGKQYCSFSVNDHVWKDGKNVDNWYQISAFGKTSDNIMAMCTSGTVVTALCDMEQVVIDGKTRTFFKVNRIKFLSNLAPRNRANEPPPNQQSNQQQQQYQQHDEQRQDSQQPPPSYTQPQYSPSSDFDDGTSGYR